ncbi:MAG TPA: hypothetical protein VGS22_03560 [Thermoanaerobaculia bacterium]|nr:hypothetical protein [Thermoanaerobaculia bacterium]
MSDPHLEDENRESPLANGASLTDFRSWIGLGLELPLKPTPRFCSNDDLWEGDRRPTGC